MFIDYHVAENCQNLEDSYGEVCVKCGKCGRKFIGGVEANTPEEAQKILDKLASLKQDK